MVLALDSRQRTNGVVATDCFGTDLAHTPALHFTFLDQVGNGSRYLLPEYSGRHGAGRTSAVNRVSIGEVTPRNSGGWLPDGCPDDRFLCRR